MWLLLFGLFLNLFNGNTQYLGLPLSPDRLVIPLALVLLLLDGRRERRQWRSVDTMILVLIAWIIGSMAWHGSLTDDVAFFAFMDRVLMPFVLFMTAPLFFSTPHRRDLLLRTLSIIGVYLGITAVFEMLQASLVFPRYIMNPSIGLQFGRARGPFIASEALGTSSAICAFAGALLAARNKGMWRLLGGSACGLGLLATGLCLTRSTWIGAVVGLLVGAWLVPRTRRTLALAGAGLAGVTATVLLSVPAAMEKVSARFNAAEPVNDRLGSTDAAIALLQDLPFTGIGWRKFYPDGAEWFRQSEMYPTNRVVIELHNVILSRAAELGIPAALLFIAIIIAGPMLIARRPASGDLFGWRALGAAAMATWLVVGLFGPMALPFPSYVTWLLVGVAGYEWSVQDPTPVGRGWTTPSLAYPGPVDAAAPPNGRD